MKTSAPFLFVFALLALLLASCASGPSVADVAADRARWRATHDVTADGVVDPQEAPLLAQLLAEWDAKLGVDERRIADQDTQWQDLLRVYGVAMLQVFGGDLEARAPELFRFVDRNSNHALDLEELQALNVQTLQNPVFAAAVVSTAVQLAARR